MEPYQERVVLEKKELDEKLAELENFIFGGKWFDVPEAERLRMVKQYGHMSDYSGILGERIAAFQRPAATSPDSVAQADVEPPDVAGGHKGS
jgi:hypothetical protein